MWVLSKWNPFKSEWEITSSSSYADQIVGEFFQLRNNAQSVRLEFVQDLNDVALTKPTKKVQAPDVEKESPTPRIDKYLMEYHNK